LLKPGGALLVVGQAVPDGWLDHATELASTVCGRALESYYAWRGMYRPEFRSTHPATPSSSFADVADAAAEVLPGAELRRGLLGRFRLRWSKPVEVPPPAESLEAFESKVAAAQTAELDGAELARAAAGPGGARGGSDRFDSDRFSGVDELARLFEDTGPVDDGRRTASHVRRSA
jgi:hypothetical protein